MSLASRSQEHEGNMNLKLLLRQRAAANAISSAEIAGFKLSPNSLEQLRRYAEGRATLEELILDAKRRHARNEAPSQ